MISNSQSQFDSDLFFDPLDIFLHRSIAWGSILPRTLSSKILDSDFVLYIGFSKGNELISLISSGVTSISLFADSEKRKTNIINNILIQSSLIHTSTFLGLLFQSS